MNVSDLKFDARNANKGNKRGREAVGKSLEQFGAGRSVLIDRDGNLIAGNKTAEQAAASGITDVIVVETDGSQLVAVKRTDLDINDPKARGLAIADNRAGELGLTWDADVLKEMSTDLDLEPFFFAHELANITGETPKPANDASAEYEGMPEFSSDDQTGVRQIIVHFETHDDVAEFSRRLDHPLTPDTKSIWFPKAERLDLQQEKYQ